MKIIEEIKRNIPRRIKDPIYWLWTFLRKPQLKYIEVHLTDHCNLNCSGCGHFSSIAPIKFTNLDKYKEDMKRLGQLFPRGIKKIRLMGGEPLLHPDAHLFIRATSAAFPKCDLHFCTNGMLLPRATAEFWEECRESKTIIDFTIYPLVRKYLKKYLSLCNKQGVDYTLTEFSGTFLAHLNFAGDSEIKKTFRSCQNRFPCPFLQEGHIYHCTKPALIHYFNENFGHRIIADKGINIHDTRITGGKILRRLRRPIITCKWCTDFVPFKWSVSEGMAEEWEADFHRK